jgi:hypothetical protein
MIFFEVWLNLNYATSLEMIAWRLYIISFILYGNILNMNNNILKWVHVVCYGSYTCTCTCIN